MGITVSTAHLDVTLFASEVNVIKQLGIVHMIAGMDFEVIIAMNDAMLRAQTAPVTGIQVLV